MSTAKRFRTVKIGRSTSGGTPFDVRLVEALEPEHGFHVHLPGGLLELLPTLEAAQRAAEGRVPIEWREALTPNANEAPCPICSSPMIYWKRYPRQICSICLLEAVDQEGVPVRMGNRDLLGTGFGMWREDGSEVDGTTCFVRGARCEGREAYFGGIVVQMDPVR